MAGKKSELRGAILQRQLHQLANRQPSCLSFEALFDSLKGRTLYSCSDIHGLMDLDSWGWMGAAGRGGGLAMRNCDYIRARCFPLSPCLCFPLFDLSSKYL
jgi:hypothetical protein